MVGVYRIGAENKIGTAIFDDAKSMHDAFSTLAWAAGKLNVVIRVWYF